MTAAEVLRRIRLFLLALASLLFAGTLLELWLVNHTKELIQWLPFFLCGLGLVVAIAVLLRRERRTVLLLRVSMALIVLGSLFGIYEHVENNIAFEKEIHPATTGRQLIMKGLGGANPLLAPGTLAVAGLLSIAATYKYSIVDE